MKKIFLLFIALIKLNVGLGHQYCLLYEKALNDFIQNEWNKNIFISECTALKFNSKTKIEINNKEALAIVDKWQVSHYLDTTLLNFILKNKSQIDFDRIYSSDSIFGGDCIDLMKYTNLIKTSNTNPGNEAKNYFMRMSGLFFWNEHIYLSFWIKKQKFSSGTHIIYQFNSDLNIVNKWNYNKCDELN